MKFRDFLKEFAKSVKSGRIHKLLRLLMAGLFLYLGFVVGKELLTYYIKKKKEVYFSVAGLKWDFSFKRGELSVKFNSLEVETPTTSVSTERGALSLYLYDSILRLRPHLGNVEVNRVAVISTGEGKGKFSLPPVVVDRVKVGELLYKKGELSVSARQLLKTETEIAAGGLVVEKGEKRVVVLPFRGYLKEGFYRIPVLTVAYGSSLLSGSAKVAENLKEGQFRGFLSSPFAELNLNIKVYGKHVVAGGKGKTLKRESEFSLTGELEKEAFSLRELQGSWDGLNFNLRGRLEREGFELTGNYWAEVFDEAGYIVKGLKGKLRGEGSYREPELYSEFGAELFVSPFVNLKKVSGRGKFTLNGGQLSFSSQNLVGEVRYEGRGERFSGNLELKSFSLYSLKPVKAAVERYRGWVPQAVLAGPVKFNYERVKGELSYSGSLKVNSFQFQNYSAGGSLQFRGNRSSVNFSLNLSGAGGSVGGTGSVDFAKRAIDSEFTGSSLRVDSFNFLKKAGLSGVVSGSGSVRGELKNPTARFAFSSDRFEVQGVPLSPLEGELLFKDMVVRISAKSPAVEVGELSYSIREGLFSLSGSAADFSAGALQKILSGYGVKLPFSLSGALTGSFSLNLFLKERPVRVEVHSQVENFAGTFAYQDLVEVSTASTKGEVNYRSGELQAAFSGDLERGSFKGIAFSGGNYGAEVKDKSISVSYSGVSLSLPQVDRVVSNGSLGIELEKQEIKGDFGFQFALRRDFVEGSGEVKAVVGGLLSNFTVKISGNGLVKSPYLKESLKLKVEGTAVEPENTGNIRIYGGGTDLRLLLFGKEAQLVGKVRNLELKAPKVEGKVNLAFVNLKLPEVSGTVSIPTFTVKPYGFYKLYSPTGVYISVNGSRVSISDFSLSYVDGWIEFKDINLEPVKGKFEGELGAKGLVYLLKLNRTVPFARNSFKVKGEFAYGKELSYWARVVGDGVVFKSQFVLDKVIVNTLRAELRNGELLKLNGELSAGDGTVLLTKTNGEVAIALSQVPVGQIGEWKSLVSGNLSASLEKRKVEGSLELSRTKLYFRKKEEEESLPEEEEEGKLPVELHIDVLFDEPVKIKGELFWIEILPTFKVITVNGRPVIAGNFYATDGEIDYMGKKFKVLYGSGTIEDLKRKKGRVSILASAHISGYYVYMKIEGPLTSPTIYLTSDPPLTREEIMNLIMTGASPEQIEASSEIFPAVQIAYYAASSFFKPIESKFQKALGLESFTVEPYITKYGETVAKLTITKRLTKRIKLIGYGTTGQNPEYGGSIDFYLTDKYYLELRYNSYYKTEAGIGFEVNLR